MSKDFKKNYVETVKEVTRTAEDCISERYEEMRENFKNLTESDKKTLESCNIKLDDASDLSSALTLIKKRWSDYSPTQKAMISETIAGVRGASTLSAYLDA